MSDRFESLDSLIGKINWEGGLLDSISYGISPQMLPEEASPELVAAWTELYDQYGVLQSAEDRVRDLLPDVEPL